MKSTPPLRTDLRNATKESHGKLDQFMDQHQIFESLAGYQVYLASMLRAYLQFQDALTSVEKEAGLSLLVPELLETLKGEVDSRYMSAWANPQANSYVSRESRWGTAYVMEGSSMGARLVLNSIKEKSDRVDWPTGYLSRLVAQAPTRWPKFVAALDQSGCDTEKTMAAANQAFDFVHRAFIGYAAEAGLTSVNKREL